MCGVLVVLTTRLWSDSRYGSEKSATFSRSGVIVVPDATASYECVRRPSKIPLKSSSSYFMSCQRSPTCPQTARMSSASKPVSTPSFTTSKGGSGKADATSRVPASIDPEVVERLLRFSSEDAPVISVYLAVPADPGELRGVETRLHSMLKPVRELGESDVLGHVERESLRHDLDRVLEVANRARELEGRGIGIFACQHAALYEEIVVPRRVRDRAVVDATPYLRPLFAVLDESHRYCVVVVDREQAWIYEFYMGELEDASRVRGRALRKPDYAGGWQGYKEHTVHDKAQQLARRHYRDTAGRVDEVMR